MSATADTATFEAIRDLELDVTGHRASAAFGEGIDQRWHAAQRARSAKESLLAALDALTAEQQVAYGEWRKAWLASTKRP